MGMKLKGIVFSIVVVLLLMSGGCSKQKSKKNDTTKKQDTTVLVWIPGDEQEYGFYFDMFENYQEYLVSQGKEFTYKIEQQPWGDYWTKLPLEVNQGRGPDLFLSHVAYTDILTSIAKPLSFSDDVLSKFKVTDLYVDSNGMPYFIPTVFVSKIMYVNTDIVSDWKKYPTTWEELIQKAQTYTNGEKGIIGFDYPFHILWDLAYQNGEYLTDNDDLVFTDAGLKKIVSWTEMGAADYLKFGAGSPEDTLYEGVAAFIYGEPWMEFWAPQEVKEKFKAFPVPSGQTHNSAELSFGINKNVSDTKYQLLNDFVQFMLTDIPTITAIVKGNSGVPNNTEVQVSYQAFTAGDAVQKTFDAGNSNLSVPPRALEQVYNTMLESVLNGMSTEQAIQEAYLNADGIDSTTLQRMENEFR